MGPEVPEVIGQLGSQHLPCRAMGLTEPEEVPLPSDLPRMALLIGLEACFSSEEALGVPKGPTDIANVWGPHGGEVTLRPWGTCLGAL